MEIAFINSTTTKQTIRPSLQVFTNLLSSGWTAQKSIAGPRIQIHCTFSEVGTLRKVFIFDEAGKLIERALPLLAKHKIAAALEYYGGWNVIEAQLNKKEKKIYLTDILVLNNRQLDHLCFLDRRTRLNEIFGNITSDVGLLPLINDPRQCMETLDERDNATQGLLFRTKFHAGFSSDSLLSCPKK